MVTRTGRKNWTWKKFYETLFDELNEVSGEFFTFNMVKDALETALDFLYRVLKETGKIERFSLYKEASFSANPVSITDGYDIYKVFRHEPVESKDYPAMIIPYGEFLDYKLSAYYGNSPYSPICEIVNSSSSYIELNVYPAPSGLSPAKVIYFIYPDFPDFESADDTPSNFPFEDELVPYFLDFVKGILLFETSGGEDPNRAIAFQNDAKRYLFDILGIEYGKTNEKA